MYKREWNVLWREELGWNDEYVDERKWNDAVETKFWESLAPLYSDEYDMNRDTEEVRNRLLSFLQEGSSVLEIGPGTGNFTIPMSEKVRKVFGIDFSAAMIQELQKRVTHMGIHNVDVVQGKWEEYPLLESYDYVVSVNSLYRILDIVGALEKIERHAKKGVILIRTLERPFFFEIYRQCGIHVKEGKDCFLLSAILGEWGRYANIEFVEYRKKRTFLEEKYIEEEMKRDLGEVYERYAGRLWKKIERLVEKNEKGWECIQPKVVAVISYEK